MKKLYLFGGGGHSLSCIDVIEKQKKFKIKGIIDKKFKIRDKILDYYWLPKWSGDISDPSARVLDVYHDKIEI